MPLTQKAFHGISQDGQKQRQRLRWYSKGEIIPLVAPGIWQVCQGIVQLIDTPRPGRTGILASTG
ncbi:MULTISPECIES: hypothetical protein [unclassified Moorena]|uniref:hypothetical protein n=1 Tax=unclassified Moorena TaxID=2683338 RepID=UPI0025F82D84|nr:MULTISPECIES: hypothetical protein [unclassified Moorena]